MENQVDYKTQYPFLNNEFFENVIENNQHVACCVQDFSLAAALGKGENYSSNLLRAKVNYTLNDNKNMIKSVKFVIKVEMSNEDTRETWEFQNEVHFFNEILPHVEQLLTSIKYDTKLTPICFASHSGDFSYLVLEDLAESGYKNYDRRNGLNFGHFKEVFSKLAKYHAATAVLLEKDPSKAKVFMGTPHIESSEKWKSLLLTCVTVFLDITKTVPGYKNLHNILESMSEDDITQLAINTYKRNDEQFNVLCHGDLWANNIMFTHDPDDGTVQDALFVDLQLVNLNSPASDLAYAIFTSFNENLDESSWNELLEHYHIILMKTLDKFGYKDRRRITLSELQEQFSNHAVFGSLIGLTAVGVRNIDEINLSLYMAQTEEGRQFRLDMLMEKSFEKSIKTILNFICKNKLFEKK